MRRFLASVICLFLSFLFIEVSARRVVVADEQTHRPLPGASIFDNKGKAIGISDKNGSLPTVSSLCYPLTIRYLGFKDETVTVQSADTVFLREDFSQLPEVIVESGSRKVLHILAYVREYSSMTTYTDTVFLFREKMVDYMLPTDSKMQFKGWTRPRVIACKSYYHFTDDQGLDSVSDVSGHHFSWSDWVSIPPAERLPVAIDDEGLGIDTVRGKYGPAEVWTRNYESVTVDIDVLADKAARRWVPEFAGFFRKDLDFDRFIVKFDYDNVEGDAITPFDLTGCSFKIESNGRGHDMFRFNRKDQPFFVTTQADVYILDKEYITVKEARKWEKYRFSDNSTGLYEPIDVPELEPWVLTLKERVENIDKEGIRLAVIPDPRIGYIVPDNHNFRLGHRALFFLKKITGISGYKTKKNLERRWNSFTQEQKHRQKHSPDSISK